MKESLGAWEPGYVESFPVKPATAHYTSLNIVVYIFVVLFIATKIVTVVFSKNSELFQKRPPCARQCDPQPVWDHQEK